MEIIIDDLQGPEIAAFLGEHLLAMRAVSPPESKHALDLEGLRKPEVTFWSLRIENRLAGCCALMELDPGHGEIKSMRTSPAFRRRGVAARLMRHLIGAAMDRGYRKLSLETGSMAYFEAARGLYESFGFRYCDPFADYGEDPNSVFMTKDLDLSPEAKAAPRRGGA